MSNSEKIIRLSDNVLIQKMYVGAIVLVNNNIYKINNDMLNIIQLIQTAPPEKQNYCFSKIGYDRIKPFLEEMIKRGILTYA